jgi:hypothetical protein
MKIARLLLAVVSLSLAAAACTADVTAPTQLDHSGAAAADSSLNGLWQGGTGSGL